MNRVQKHFNKMDEEKEARIPEIALPVKTEEAASEFLAPEAIDANFIEEKSDKVEELIAESPLTDNTEEEIPLGNSETENIGESDNLPDAEQEELVEKSVQPENQILEEKSDIDLPLENSPVDELNIEESLQAQSIENEAVQEESLNEQPVEEKPAGEHPFPEKSPEEQPVNEQPIEAIAEIQEFSQQIAQEH